MIEAREAGHRHRRGARQPLLVGGDDQARGAQRERLGVGLLDEGAVESP